MMFEELLSYLKVYTVSDIVKMYQMHKDLPEYEPYWLKLKNQLQQAIAILEREEKE